MAGNEEKVVGPDLAQGLPSQDIGEGAMMVGHVADESVLLARIRGRVYAVGATCTHYGGPLGEGILIGESVRCPWHHACFSIRTGEAIRAPALNPLPCWDVEERDGRIVLGAKREREPLLPADDVLPDPVRARRRVVIVGAGAAGAVAAEMLRRRGHTGNITMIDTDGAAPYDRPNLSKDYLAGKAPEEWIPLRAPDFYPAHGIEILRARATGLDLTARQVQLDTHGRVPFDILLLATGAEPAHLRIPGGDRPHVHYLRTLADSRAIIAGAAAAKRAVVIGASFIGLEVAASLRARGLDVHVVAPETRPLQRVMGEQLGTMIESVHRSQGVTFHLGTTAARIETDAVVLANSDRIATDLVVIGIGVRPRDELASGAGLAVDNGVLVNEYLETSVEGVYAAGDIARWPDRRTGERIRVEHWVVAERQGQVAACNIMGASERFDCVPFFWSAHYGVTINYVGHASSWDAARVDGDLAAHDAFVRFERGGRTLAVATVGRDRENLNAELALERQREGAVTE